MEIKVQCDCGQKFKFDVEPVNGRMPFAVNCPVCGTDGTARANVILQQLLPPAPIAAAFAPAPAPISAPAPAPMRPAGLSINRPQALKPATPDSEEVADEAEAGTDSSEEGGVREVKIGWKIWAIIIFFICWGIVGSIEKISRHVTVVKDLVTWVKGLMGGDSGDDEHATALNSRADQALSDDGTLLLVKATDHVAVAQAVADFYSEHFQQKLFSSTVTNIDELEEEARYLVLPAREGGVEIDVDVFADKDEMTNVSALAKFLSQKFATAAICEVMSLGTPEQKEAMTSSVIIYENGEKKFQFDHNVRLKGISLKETVKVDGEAWATSLGFKPGSEGFKEFSVEDAEKLAQTVGFKPAGQMPPTEWILLSTKPAKP